MVIKLPPLATVIKFFNLICITPDLYSAISGKQSQQELLPKLLLENWLFEFTLSVKLISDVDETCTI